MKFTKHHILLFWFFLLIGSNIYSQTERFDKLFENRINRHLHSVHLDPTDYLINNERINNLTTGYLRKQNDDSTSVIDSIIVMNADSNYNKYYYTYDATGNRILELTEEGLHSYRRTNTYDTNGNLILFFFERQYFSEGEFENDYRTIYSYDPNGNMTSKLGEYWISSKWVNGSRGTYIYDSNGNRISELIEIWKESNWVNFWRNIATYNSNGNSTSVLGESWDGSNWGNEWRETYTYDFNGNMIWEFSERWDGSQWVNYKRTTYTYDTSGNMTFSFTEDWDGSNWVNIRRGFYIYDSNENMTEHSSEDWDGSNWVNYTRCTYTYDANGNITYAINEKLQDENWVASNGSIHFYDSFGNNVHEVKIYHSIIITDILESKEIITEYNLSQNYPNPFNPSTLIKYQIPVETLHATSTTNVILKIYDILGREITTLVNKEQKPGVYEVSLDASQLSSGTYFYRLISGEYSETKKMLILK